ncbi:MAG: cation diffusion facilitator family transporter [Anaerolineae bacterium]|jgi:cobalt-zinc-cadmium efflux system protein
MTHHHDHHHHGDVANLKVAFWLNLGFALFEIVGGIWTSSLAVVSDAVHDLGDSVSLGLAWFLARVSERSEDARYSYGYRRFSLLGALINTLVLIVGGGLVLRRAIPALWAPERPDAPGMALLAVVGIAINGLAVLRLRKQRSLNARTAALHLLEDVLGWVAVLVVSGALLIWDVPVLDPLLSVVISVYVLYRAVVGLVSTMRLFLQGVPPSVDLRSVEQALSALEGVCEVHHAHAWSLDGDHNVFSSHLVVSSDTPLQEALEIKHRAKHVVAAHGFDHVTIEVEYSDQDCSMGACCDECPEDAADPAHEHACAPPHDHVHEEVRA